MRSEIFRKLKLRAAVEKWPFVHPFRIAGHVWDSVKVVVVTLGTEAHQGKGEAFGVYYRQETSNSILAQIDSVRSEVESEISRCALQRL